MTTILVFGDIHIKPDNALEIDMLKNKLIEHLDKIHPTFTVILGDVLDTHERILSNCLNRAYDLFKTIKEKSELFILVGNHDQYNNKQFLTENHWMNAMKEWNGKITIVDKVIMREFDGNLFTFIPFVETGRFMEALETSPNWKKSSIIFAHQEFKGCSMNDKISSNGDVWNKAYPQIISGHIHNSQTLGNIYYPGSILQTSFGEKSNSILLLLKVNHNDIDMKEIRLNLPRQETIELNIEDVDSYDFSKKKPENKMRLIIIGKIEEFATFKASTKYKELVKQNIKILFSKKQEDVKKIEKCRTSLFTILRSLVGEDKELLDIYNEVIEINN